MTKLCSSGVCGCLGAFALAAALAQTPPAQQPPQEKPAEKKAPVKRVRVDLAGFELGQAPAPKSTQIGGGTRSMGGDTTLLAPAIGRCYTDKPELAWTHSAQVQNFEVRLYDQSGTLVHRLKASGRHSVIPADHAIQPGGTLIWSAQPENAMLGGPSAKSTIKRLTAAELAEVDQQLKSPGAADPLEWRAQVFTDRRLWYDAIAAWSELVEKFPHRADLHEKRGQIYDQLPATQPLADEDFAAAEKIKSR